MKYKLIGFVAPHALVEYTSKDASKKAILNVRIDLNQYGLLPVGDELDAYILSFAPSFEANDPYSNIDWSPIEALVTPTKEVERNALLSRLREIDLKSIRALREGNFARISALESDAQVLRDSLSGLSV